MAVVDDEELVVDDEEVVVSLMPAEEDVDFEVEVDVVDVVSVALALAVVSSDVNAFESDSILVATAP